MIEITVTKHSYDGDGANLEFPYDFRIDHKTHIKVWVDDVLKTVDTHYTVSNVGAEGGGQVTFITAPPVGTGNVVLERVSPKKQLVDLPDGGPFFTEEVEENMADKLCMMIQELLTMFGAAVAGKTVKWDSRGQDLVAEDLGLFASFINETLVENDNFIELTFDEAAADTNYMVTIQTNWNHGGWWVPDAQKTVSGFRVYFGNGAGPNPKINVMVYA